MTEDGQFDLGSANSGDARSTRTADRESLPQPEITHAPQPPASADSLRDSVGRTDAQPALEASSSSGPPTASCRPAPQQVFYLTNRMNLNGILSSRMIAPRESFEKYYTDLLALCPGWVPLLTGRPPADLIEHVLSERGAGTPVLIELFERALGDASPVDAITYVPAVALTEVKAIHFRDKRALREHRARTYSNVHPHDDLLQVTPELFELEARSDIQITAPEGAMPTDWNRIDRIRGAINAVLAASDSGEALALAATAIGADHAPSETPCPTWLRWSALTGEGPAAATESPNQRADRQIFHAAYQTLSAQDQSQSWSPSSVLGAVRNALATSELDTDTQAIVDRNIDRIQELIDVEREFEPFRSDSPFVAAKSLLMVLLRPDLEQLLAWPDEETGADATTRSVAALLAGCLRGVARESTTLRSQSVDDLTAAWAVTLAAGKRADTLGKVAFVADASKTMLSIDGDEIRSAAPLVPWPEDLYREIPAEAQSSTRVVLSRQFGWPITVRVTLPVNAEVSRDDSFISVTSVEQIPVQRVVEEPAFLERLRTLSGRDRKRANDLLIQAKTK